MMSITSSSLVHLSAIGTTVFARQPDTRHFNLCTIIDENDDQTQVLVRWSVNGSTSWIERSPALFERDDSKRPRRKTTMYNCNSFNVKPPTLPTQSPRKDEIFSSTSFDSHQESNGLTDFVTYSEESKESDEQNSKEETNAPDCDKENDDFEIIENNLENLFESLQKNQLLISSDKLKEIHLYLLNSAKNPALLSTSVRGRNLACLLAHYCLYFISRLHRTEKNYRLLNFLDLNFIRDMTCCLSSAVDDVWVLDEIIVLKYQLPYYQEKIRRRIIESRKKKVNKIDDTDESNKENKNSKTSKNNKNTQIINVAYENEFLKDLKICYENYKSDYLSGNSQK